MKNIKSKVLTISIVGIVVFIVSLSLFLEYGLPSSENQETDVMPTPTQSPDLIENTRPPDIPESTPTQTPAPDVPPPTPWPYESELNTDDRITFRTEYEVYSVGTQRITTIITNHSEYLMGFGENFLVQRINGTLWENVCRDIEILEFINLVYPKSSVKYHIDLTLLEQPVVAGRYRVIKQIGDNRFSAEFELKN